MAVCRRIRADTSRPYVYVILLTALDARSHELLAARLRVAERILGLRRHVDDLEKLLPICMYCKNIRDGSGQWMRVEDFLKRETRPAVARAAEEWRRRGSGDGS